MLKASSSLDARDQQRSQAPNAAAVTTSGQSSKIAIYVFDETTGSSRNFHCRQDVLLQHMKYFCSYLQPPTATGASGGGNTNNLQDVEISVHCDIGVFAWLVRYMENPGHQIAKMTANNVVSILISADFLQMDVLVEECLNFLTGGKITADVDEEGGLVAGSSAEAGTSSSSSSPRRGSAEDRRLLKQLDQVLALPIDLNCLNPSLLASLADRLSPEQLEDLRDEGDKLVSKLYEIHLDRLLEQFSSTLDRCVFCKQLFFSKYSTSSGALAEHDNHCPQAELFIDYNGRVIAQHVKDDVDFDLFEYVNYEKQASQLPEVKTLKWLYWSIYGRLFFLKGDAGAPESNRPGGGKLLPLVEFCGGRESCYYHPEDYCPETSSYPCCGFQVRKFDPTGGTSAAAKRNAGSSSAGKVGRGSSSTTRATAAAGRLAQMRGLKGSSMKTSAPGSPRRGPRPGRTDEDDFTPRAEGCQRREHRLPDNPEDAKNVRLVQRFGDYMVHAHSCDWYTRELNLHQLLGEEDEEGAIALDPKLAKKISSGQHVYGGVGGDHFYHPRCAMDRGFCFEPVPEYAPVALQKLTSLARKATAAQQQKQHQLLHSHFGGSPTSRAARKGGPGQILDNCFFDLKFPGTIRRQRDTRLDMLREDDRRRTQLLLRKQRTNVIKRPVLTGDGEENEDVETSGGMKGSLFRPDGAGAVGNAGSQSPARSAGNRGGGGGKKRGCAGNNGSFGNGRGDRFGTGGAMNTRSRTGLFGNDNFGLRGGEQSPGGDKKIRKRRMVMGTGSIRPASASNKTGERSW